MTLKLISTALLTSTAALYGAINVSGAGNKAAVAAGTSVTVTITAEAGFTSVATLDGTPLPIATPVMVTSPQYHEVKEIKTPTAGGAATTSLYQFIILAAGRSNTESGLPPFTPYPVISDAPSAFTGSLLQYAAPVAFPAGMPVPVAAMLRTPAGEPRRLNGVIHSGNVSTHPIVLRRGWGSAMLPAGTAGTNVNYDGSVGGLAAPLAVNIEPATTWTTKSGTIASETWGPDGRIDVTADLTITGTLTVLPGTVVRLARDVTVNVNAGGTLLVNASRENPACFSAASLAQPWGGIRLRASGAGGVATLSTTGLILSSYGSTYNWFATNTGYAVHRNEQAGVLADTGAICALTDTYLLDGRGQAFHCRNGNMNLSRCLIHKATTGGELAGGQVDIDRSAFIDFHNRPNGSTTVFLDETPGFVDADNDGLYLVPNSSSLGAKTWTVTRTVIGWTKDDGIDTGGSGAGTTKLTDSWIESCYHEAMSHSGSGRIPESRGSVHYSCGQGFECGYDSPQSFMDGSAVLDCMVGTRYGDNYTSGFTYGGTLTVRNSLVLSNQFHDVWGFAWNTVGGDSTKAWTYNVARMTIENNYLSKPNTNHPSNTVWDPAANGALLAPFMPVPDAEVGAAWLASKTQETLSAWPGTFTARLSTFSSQQVTTGYRITAKSSPDSVDGVILASGTLTFPSGEVMKSTPPVTVTGDPAMVLVEMLDGENGAVTGPPLLFYKTVNPTPDATPIAMGAGGWSYSAIRAEPTTGWTGLGYTESAAQWQTDKTAPIGFGNIGATGTLLTINTTLTAAEQGSSTDRTKAVYFRKRFTVANPADVRALTVSIIRDDGASVYINGYKVEDTNITAGAAVGGVISYNTLATNTVDGGPERTVYNLNAPLTVLEHLNAGTDANVIALEVHQVALNSSDLVMDLSINVSYNAPTAIPAWGLGQSAGRPFLYWLDPLVELQSSRDLIVWPQDRANVSPFFPADNGTDTRRFWRLYRP